MTPQEKQLLDQQKELADHYKNLSEVHLAELEDLQNPIVQIMIAKGVLIEIESDLLKYLQSKPATDQSRKQEQRIEIINRTIRYFDKIAMNNYQMKLMLRQAARELVNEKIAHSQTQTALDMATNILNEHD